MEWDELVEWYKRERSSITDTFRARRLNYGTNSDKVLLAVFDRLGEIIDGDRRDSGGPPWVAPDVGS